MKRTRNSKRQAALNLPTIQLEGSLFLPDQLEKAAQGRATDQTEVDYGVPKGVKLKDEYSRSFQIAKAQWQHFAAQMERTDLDAHRLTVGFVSELLRDALGYAPLQHATAVEVGGLAYPISMIAGQVAVLVAPHGLGLDDPDARFAVVGGGNRKKSAFQTMQELLNASPEHTWGMVSNGKQLRLLRDAASLTRPTYLQFDLADLLGGQRYAEFANVWRLLHASRAPQAAGSACVWERWREAGKAEGTRVRDGLRNGVEQALLTFGEGFLQHPANDSLRSALNDGSLSKDAYFQQLLRLIYRLIFVFTVEERGVLHPLDDSAEALAARKAYAEGYALSRLRELCLKRRARNRHDDLWQAIRIVWRGLAHGQDRLALPALGGLFALSQCADLDGASLHNTHLLAALKHLRWADPTQGKAGALVPVDYRNMGPEELGSVYESLLELVPEIDIPARKFNFFVPDQGVAKGNDRKKTGSYYTPDSLVQELIKSALDPVINQRLQVRPENPTEALLSIRVMDPACGSGHFLLAAARRLAEKLAQLRSIESGQEGAVRPQDYRHALREVVSRCIYGVDRNPMAIELARTALWLEGFEEGRPLGFLDHHLQVGDALLGLTDLKALELGIAKDAFKPLSGDDKEVCKQLAKANAAALKDLEKKRKACAVGQLDVASSQESGLKSLQAVEALPENSTQEIAAKEAAYRAFLEQAKTSRLAYAADLLVGAYLLPKREGAEPRTPTSATLYLTLLGDVLPTDQQGALAAAQTACAEARVLHWPLAFPQVFAGGGFDCVLGNPPWERIKLHEEEFFATRHRDVFDAKNKAERSQRIQWLAEGMLAKHLFPQLKHAPYECEAEQRLYAEFISARRTAEAASVFAHVKREDGGRYPLTGVGDVNTYALFSETIYQIVAPTGRAGFVVPSGLATDNSTKDFFGRLISKKSLDSFFEFENEGFFSGAGQGHMLRFALTTIVGAAQQAPETRFLFQGKKIEHLHDPERVFTLSPEDIFRVNPNTLTCPIFQSRHDAEITKNIYQRVPVLIREARGNEPECNPWGIRFMAMFHMSNDSHLFKTHEDLIHEGYELVGNHLKKGDSDFVPLYEAKMVYHYNHRYSDFSQTKGERAHILPKIPVERLKDMSFEPMPFYWVPTQDMENRYKEKKWDRRWALGFRDVTDSRASARSFVGTVIPRVAVGNKYPLMLSDKDPRLVALLLANLTSISFDYFCRQKIGGLTMNFFIVKQLPVLPPESYREKDLEFIVNRVLKLTYSSLSMKGWAKDLGYDGDPIEFNEEERARVQAELDAYFARLYGLKRDELQFILDPESIKPGYPSETFAVLKRNESRIYDEYRTQRLVLGAWDKLGKVCKTRRQGASLA